MKEFSLKEKARLIGIPPSTLRDFVKRNGMPSPKTVGKFMDVVDTVCYMKDLLNKKKNPHINKQKTQKPEIKKTENRSLPKVVKKIPTGKLSDMEKARRLLKLNIKKCPSCGSELKVFYSEGKNNTFVGCTGFFRDKKCRFTMDLIA